MVKKTGLWTNSGLWLFLILGIALSLRLAGIFHSDMYEDEAFSISVTKSPSSAIFAVYAYEEHPPLYSVLLFGWRSVFGSKLWVLRLFSVLSGVAAVVLSYLIVRYFLPEKAALLSMFLVSIAADHVRQSQMVRPYAFIVMVIFAMLFFFVKVIKENRGWFGFALFSVLAGYSTHFSSLMLVTLFIFALFQFKRLDFKRFLLVEAIVIIFLIPEIVYAWNQLGFLGYMAELAQLRNPYWHLLIIPYNAFAFLFGSFSPFLSSFNINFSLLPGLLIFLALFALLFVYGLRMRRDSLVFFILTFSMPLLLILAVSLFTYMQIEPKRFLFVSLGLYAIIASGLSRLRPGHFRIAMGLIIISSAIGLGGVFSVKNLEWGGVASYIESKESQGDAIGVCHSYVALTIDQYYHGGSLLFGVPVDFLDNAHLSSFSRQDLRVYTVKEGNFEYLFSSRLVGKSRLWYVANRLEVGDPKGLFLSYLESRFRLIEKKSFSDGKIMVYLFSLKG